MKMRVGLTAMCVLSAAIAGCEKKQAATGTATQSNNQSSSGNTPPADDALAALMDHEIPHVSLAAQASVMVRDVADALTDITNVARAEDQLPTLTMFRDEMKNLRDRARALGDPSQDALDILNNKLGPMMMPEMERLERERTRIRNDIYDAYELVNELVDEFVRSFQSI